MEGVCDDGRRVADAARVRRGVMGEAGGGEAGDGREDGGLVGATRVRVVVPVVRGGCWRGQWA